MSLLECEFCRFLYVILLYELLGSVDPSVMVKNTSDKLQLFKLSTKCDNFNVNVSCIFMT